MEIRRIEGILLEETILSRRAHEAYQTARSLEIRITSRVPEVLSTLFQLPRLRARVLESSATYLLLQLEDGTELSVRNDLRIPVEKGALLVLLPLRRGRDLVLRVVEVREGKENTLRLFSLFRRDQGLPVKFAENFRAFLNSGLFYENKLLRAILKDSYEELSADYKYTLLKEERKELVNFVNLLQMYVVENGRERLYFPFSWEEKRGRLFFSIGDPYRVLIELEFPSGRILVEIVTPRSLRFLDLRVKSDSELLLEKLKAIKEELDLPIPVRNFELRREEGIEEEFLRAVFGEGSFSLKV
ncbi:MAG: hypothetical protein GXN96_02435 [Aquificae bacterium]|nr:hypothetical protein [Aquificota bacterium]